MNATAILDCLKELNVPLTKEQFTHPEEHKEVVKSVLENLAILCLGLTHDELASPAFAGLNAITYPELHEEAVPIINSFRAISKMMEFCGIPDFSLRDLIAPDAKRLSRQLSGIMNFAKFRLQKIGDLEKHNRIRDQLMRHLDSVRERNDALNTRLSLLRASTAEEEHMIRQLEADIVDYESTMKTLQAQLSSCEEELTNWSNQHVTLKGTVATAEEELEDLRSLQKRLAGQIVTSPEKFRKQIIEIGQTLQHEQRDTKTAEKKVRELTAWIGNIEEAQNEINAALDGINDVRSEVEKQKAMIGELDGHKQSMDNVQSALSLLQQNTAKQTRAIARNEEKVAQLRKQATQRASEGQENMENVHKQIVEAEAFRMQVKNRGERLEGEAHRLEKELEVENAAQEQELSDIRQTYGKLEKKVIAHLHDLQGLLEHSSPASERQIGGIAGSRYV